MFKKLKKKVYLFLRGSQKYTKTDMIYLAKGGFWLNLGQAIASIAGMSLAVAFANLLDPETYGTFKFIISFVAILSIPCLQGINQAVVRAVAQGNEGTFFPALKTKMKWGVFGGAGALMLAGYYFYNDNSVLGFSFLIMAGFIPFFNNLNLWIQYLNGKKNFKTLSQYKAAMRIIAVSAIVAALFFTQNLFLILFIHFAANTVSRLFFLSLSLKKYPPNKKHDPSTIGYGKHLSLMGILGPISNQLDKILLFHFLGPIQLAIYTFSLRPIQEMRKPLNSLSELALPKMSQRSLRDLEQSIPAKMLKLFIVLVPIATAYIFIAPYFYQFLFPQYTEATVYSQVFVLSVLLFPKMLMGQALTAHAQKKQLYILRLATPAAKIIFLLTLLPLWGIWGAIISLIATEAVNALLLLFFFFKKNKTEYKNSVS
ncbi:MAG: oligosaccharide flippase family protein [Patescibacteria group bacterium]